MSSIMKLYKDSLPPSGTERAARDVDDARASHGASDGTYFETKANGSDASGGSGSLGSAATDIMADAFVSADGVLQEHLDVSRGKYDGSEFHREFLTPSPTGPLDASPFFDEPFSAAEEAR
jgi:hypothetical protein